jgi:hypothetical protein
MRMLPRARQTWIDAYGIGYLEGLEAGRRQVEDEWRGLDQVSVAIARQVAERVPFDQLADRRGQHDRAERQRSLLRERGVVA